MLSLSGSAFASDLHGSVESPESLSTEVPNSICGSRPWFSVPYSPLAKWYHAAPLCWHVHYENIQKTAKRKHQSNRKYLNTSERWPKWCVYSVTSHFIFPGKKEDSNHCLQIVSQITHLHSVVKAKSYTTSESGPIFSNKFANHAWQPAYIWGCSVIPHKIKLTTVSPMWKEYRKVHQKGTIKNTKINIAGVIACLLILDYWEKLSVFFENWFIIVCLSV